MNNKPCNCGAEDCPQCFPNQPKPVDNREPEAPFLPPEEDTRHPAYTVRNDPASYICEYRDVRD